MKKYIATFILALVFFLIANAPATLITPYIKNINNLQVTNIHGSIWHGSLSSNQFERLTWRVNPFYLALGSLSADIKIKIDQANRLNATANINLFQNASLEDISGTITTNYLQQLNPTLPIIAQAKFAINNAKITWDDIKNQNIPSLAQGGISIQKVNLLGEQLGNYDAKFNYQNNLLKSSIVSNASSKVNTNINLTLNPQFKLTIKGTIQPITSNLKSIFKELNIPTKQDYSIQL
jgi:hypothetical protein